MVRIDRPSNLRHGFSSFEYSQLSPLSMVEFDRASSCFVSPTHWLSGGMQGRSKYEMVTAGGALLAYYAPLPSYQPLPVQHKPSFHSFTPMQKLA